MIVGPAIRAGMSYTESVSETEISGTRSIIVRISVNTNSIAMNA